MATYIFDFDGTIADSFSFACTLLMKHADYLGCRQVSGAELESLKDLHAYEVLKSLGISFWRVAFFVRKLRRLTQKQVDEIPIFPQWSRILKQLSLTHQIGLISSNSSEVVRFVLKKYDLFDLFHFMVCDQSLFGKKRCLNRLIRQKKLSPLSTFYIGDEVRDIEAAHASQIQSIAVSWGFNSEARLKEAKPHYLMNQIEDLERFLIPPSEQ